MFALKMYFALSQNNTLHMCYATSTFFVARYHSRVNGSKKDILCSLLIYIATAIATLQRPLLFAMLYRQHAHAPTM